MTAPGWRPELVALDVDGTLLVPDHDAGMMAENQSAAVRTAVLDVVAAGVPVVLASGRSPLSLTGFADRMGLTEAAGQIHVVAANGAVVARHPGLEIVHEVTFDASAAVRLVLDHVPAAAVAVEEHGVGYRVNRHFPPGELDGTMRVSSIEEMMADEVTRVIIRDPDSTSEDFVNLAEKLGLHGTNYYIGWTAWLDLAPEGISKASGVQWVCDRVGVAAAEVLAIGDGRNDSELLEWAGRGVAMGQAPPEVRALADHVTGTVFEDGAAQELRRWF